MNTSFEIFKILFPQEGTFLGRGGNELNGLNKNTEPTNCCVHVKTSKPDHRGDRRDHYALSLVFKDSLTFVELRICKALASVGYEEFVVMHREPQAIHPDQLQECIENSYANRLSKI